MNLAEIEFQAPSLTDEDCWQAMLTRDAHYDGTFVTGVVSTGIYCRPSCPARKPLRSNVVFFPNVDAAERAGFRACKRCRPQAQPSDAEMVERLCRYIETNLDGDLTLAALGAHMNYSPFHLQRVFKRAVGISPRQYAEAARLGRLKTELKRACSVTDAIYEAGFNSSSAVYEGSPSSALGMDPKTYRRGGQGMTIGYTIVDSALGRLMVAATKCGIAGVCLGDTDAVLEEFIREEFPNAEVHRDDDGLSEWVQPILNQLSGEPVSLDLPVDVQATAFQWRVWNRLRAIPIGETRTYGEIARELGDPKAARAVARACATNPVAVIIPCHRVVQGDGGLGGYRWGVERKRALLNTERHQREDGMMTERAEAAGD